MDVSAREALRKEQAGAFFCPGRPWYNPQWCPPPSTKKKVREGGRGEGGGQSENWELRTVFSQLRIRSCQMSIMAFELPIVEMAFALSEFEFKVFT